MCKRVYSKTRNCLLIIMNVIEIKNNIAPRRITSYPSKCTAKRTWDGCFEWIYYNRNGIQMKDCWMGVPSLPADFCSWHDNDWSWVGSAVAKVPDNANFKAMKPVKGATGTTARYPLEINQWQNICPPSSTAPDHVTYCGKTRGYNERNMWILNAPRCPTNWTLYQRCTHARYNSGNTNLIGFQLKVPPTPRVGQMMWVWEDGQSARSLGSQNLDVTINIIWTRRYKKKTRGSCPTNNNSLGTVTIKKNFPVKYLALKCVRKFSWTYQHVENWVCNNLSCKWRCW